MSDAEPESQVEAEPRPSGVTVFLATGAYVGFIPVAPGTFGALWGLPLAWVIGQLPFVWLQIVVVVIVCAVGVPLCTAAVRRLGGEKDPGAVVFDEIASVPIAFLFVPAAWMNRPLVLLAGFVLIRIFDIAKPPPVRQLEKLPDGLGVMADDWAAGVYACAALHLLLWLTPLGG
jgi:phosphatidylglycerophosphatase A